MRYVSLLLLCGLSLIPLAHAENLDHPVAIDDSRTHVAPRTIVETLKNDGHYKILLSTLEGTELEKNLSSDGLYTFFAPTDRAFERVPELTLLLQDRQAVMHVLNHHTIAGKVYEYGDLRSFTTLLSLIHI